MTLENNAPRYSPDISEYKHQFVKNETTNVLTPSSAMVDITSIVCDMLQDNLLYTNKNGATEKAIKSRIKLLKILQLTETFNTIATQNLSLKQHNRSLLEELNEIKRQERLANSI